MSRHVRPSGMGMGGAGGRQAAQAGSEARGSRVLVLVCALVSGFGLGFCRMEGKGVSCVGRIGQGRVGLAVPGLWGDLGLVFCM